MKKFLLTLVALMAMAVTADAQTVYISTGDGAVAYHKSKSCSYLTKSKEVKSVTTAEAKKLGRHECSRCYGTASAAASKKATTTAKKPASTTTTKTATTTTPARDEKGRFIKTTDQKSTKKTSDKKSTKTTEKKVKKAA
jgi:hypothetical protein